MRDRGIYGLRGARNLAGWLHADARLADDARKLARLAAMGPDLPKITALLASGTISLTQASTACWQISQLPDLPVPPDTAEPADPPDPFGPPAPSGPAAGPGAGDGDAENSQQDSAADGPDDSAADDRGDSAADDPQDVDGDSGRDAETGQDTGPGPSGAGLFGAGDPAGDAWAGLWRAGDVHAAADELFAAFLPGLDADQLRQLGAHLREAADSQDHAADNSNDYARRGLRISRSLGGAGEISGRLDAEAAEQVIAAFEELGAKTGPDDQRSKAQRWADVLTRLAATTPGLPAHAASARPADADDPAASASTPASPAADPSDEDDDQPGDTNPETGHHHPTGHDHGTRDTNGPGDTGQDHPGDGLGPNAGLDHHGQPHDPNAACDDGGDGQDDSDSRPGTVPAAYRRPRVIVTAPLSTLLGQPLAPGATLGSGTQLTAEAARRLACDAEIIRLITGPADQPDGGRNGDATARLTKLLAAAIAQLPPPLATPSAVLDIGRKSPGWTPRQRDALYVQYGGHCGFGRCGGPIDVIHHIIHWLYGGKTRIINGFPCCKYHHWLLHEGGWRIKKHRDGKISIYPPPPGWRPGTIYRHGKPLTE
jgi:hypothetical protein